MDACKPICSVMVQYNTMQNMGTDGPPPVVLNRWFGLLALDQCELTYLLTYLLGRIEVVALSNAVLLLE